jgi:lipid II:glycine glycyltransferase (peptidoglycan interpeptide bridge formation enzyme)
MHYQLRAIPAEQQDQWDRFVSEHPQGHLLQSWQWGELKACTGWSPLRLALWDTEQQAIVAGAQVLRRTAPHLPLSLGHLAYIPKGPLLDWSQGDLCTAFFMQLHRLLRQQGAIALRIEPALEMGTADAELFLKQLAALRTESILLARAVPATQPLRTIILDLTPDEQTLLAQMKEKWRYNVRLAGRKGVTVRTAETAEDVRQWYQLMQVTAERDQFGIHSYEYYVQVWQLFHSHNQVQLLLAEHDGRLQAGIFLGVFARQALYLYGASSNEQRQLMPNYLLQWEAIRRAKQQGALHYDFWGIPETEDETEAMAGVYRFKRGWGGRVVQFPGAYQHVYHSLVMRIASRFI